MSEKYGTHNANTYVMNTVCWFTIILTVRVPVTHKSNNKITPSNTTNDGRQAREKKKKNTRRQCVRFVR